MLYRDEENALLNYYKCRKIWDALEDTKQMLYVRESDKFFGWVNVYEGQRSYALKQIDQLERSLKRRYRELCEVDRKLISSPNNTDENLAAPSPPPVKPRKSSEKITQSNGQAELDYLSKGARPKTDIIYPALPANKSPTPSDKKDDQKKELYMSNELDQLDQVPFDQMETEKFKARLVLKQYNE